MEVNISNYLAELTNSKGDDIAIAYRRNLRLARWSYARLISAIFQFAGDLEARGVTKGDRVIICGENCPEWVIAFYGCILRGVVVVPLDTQSTPDFVARICEQVRPALFIRGMTSGGIAPALPTLILEEISGTIAGRPVKPRPAQDIKATDTAQIIRTVKQERISVIAAVPRVLQLLREKVERDFTARGELEELHRQLDAAARWSWLTRWWRFRGVHQQFGWKCLAFVTGAAPLDA